jgi:hypothetical protein
MWLAAIYNIENEKQNWKKECETESEADQFIQDHLNFPHIVNLQTREEKKDLSLDAEYQYSLKVELRKNEYNKFKDEMLEALLEKEQGKPQRLVEVLARYEKVKTDIPLPEKPKKD